MAKEREPTDGRENGELKSTEFTMITETSVLSSLSKVERWRQSS